MAAPDRIAFERGLRRPWTMIAAEVLAWVQVLFFVLFSSVDGFCGWTLFVAVTFFFVGISLAIHNGRWKGALFSLFGEWILLTFLLAFSKTGTRFERFTVREIGKDSSVHASTISEVAIYSKDEGAIADSHPENPEDGSKAPFTDNKIALYLGYVNGGWK